MPTVKAYGAQSKTTPLEAMNIDRREPSASDIAIDIDFCGVCHSDIHQTRDEWNFNPPFPMVPGHEIIGHVTAIGAKVTNFKIGDKVEFYETRPISKLKKWTIVKLKTTKTTKTT